MVTSFVCSIKVFILKPYSSFISVTMPLSQAERAKRYRKKLKQKLGDRAVKEMDAKRKAVSRLKETDLAMEKERERQLNVDSRNGRSR